MNKTLLRPICWIKTVWRSINRQDYIVDFIPIMGHDYIEQENGDLICGVCGHKS